MLGSRLWASLREERRFELHLHQRLLRHEDQAKSAKAGACKEAKAGGKKKKGA
jgi:hypothetical protein